MQPGLFKPGSLTDRVLKAIQAGEGMPVTRAALRAPLSRGEQGSFHRIIDKLVVRGLVRETCAGFVPADAPRLAADPAETRHHFDRAALSPVAEPLRLRLDAITRRAHALAAHGRKASAVLLLNTASRHPALPAHVAAGFGALADLFRHHDLERAA